MSRIGALVGLPMEAAILGRGFAGAAVQIDIRCANADPGRAAAEAASLAAGGFDLLLSFGFAGALDPALRAGDLLLADRVVGAGAAFHADRAARDRLAAALALGSRVLAGAILGVEQVIDRPGEKARLFAATRAMAVDMESLPLFAAAAGKPALALRAIADPASRTIPRAALRAIDRDGNPDIGKLLVGLLRRPADIGGVLALARDSGRAKATLGRAALVAARSLF